NYQLSQVLLPGKTTPVSACPLKALLVKPVPLKFVIVSNPCMEYNPAVFEWTTALPAAVTTPDKYQHATFLLRFRTWDLERLLWEKAAPIKPSLHLKLLRLLLP